jgi:hypothetical protein
MRIPGGPDAVVEGPARHPAVAGSFYPDDPASLRTMVVRLLAAAEARATQAAGIPQGAGAPPGHPDAILVPHAGLEWSGVVAAAAWRLLGARPAPSAGPGDGPDAGPPIVVILGTNHSAWLDGIGAWDAGAWQTPLGAVTVETSLAAEIAGLGPPFRVDRAAHLHEHSIEVQLPLLQVVAPGARIVPLAVSTGTGRDAITAGARLGRLLADHHGWGRPVMLAISTDLAHYPPHAQTARVTETLLPAILELDASRVAHLEGEARASGVPGLACGMCGIEPTVVGLAALEAWGSMEGRMLDAATSADAGGPRDRTVGYLSVAWSRRTMG